MKSRIALKRLGFPLVAAALLLGGGRRVGAEEPKHEQVVYLTAEEAGADGKTQGEYLGTAGGGEKLGCQVIADGEGNFRAVFLPGGLPGEGSDNKVRIEVKGKTEGDKTTLGEESKGYSGVITGDTLSGKTDKGDAFELKKTARHSPTESAPAPTGAIVLFDGSNTNAWDPKAKMDDRHFLFNGCTTKQQFTDYTLHVEFMEPLKPFARGQERGNSGVYQQNHYEVQVLDSFGLPGNKGDCGAIYSHIAPTVNVSYPPLSWQTYDIDFTAARYDPAGKKVSPAYITLKWNGVVVHDHVAIAGPTGGQDTHEHPDQQVQKGPIYLQAHGNKVYFKNIWIVDKGGTLAAP